MKKLFILFILISFSCNDNNPIEQPALPKNNEVVLINKGETVNLGKFSDDSNIIVTYEGFEDRAYCLSTNDGKFCFNHFYADWCYAYFNNKYQIIFDIHKLDKEYIELKIRDIFNLKDN